MFRELVRKNKQIPAEECIALLTKETRGVLSVNGDDSSCLLHFKIYGNLSRHSLLLNFLIYASAVRIPSIAALEIPPA